MKTIVLNIREIPTARMVKALSVEVRRGFPAMSMSSERYP